MAKDHTNSASMYHTESTNRGAKGLVRCVVLKSMVKCWFYTRTTKQKYFHQLHHLTPTKHLLPPSSGYPSESQLCSHRVESRICFLDEKTPKWDSSQFENGNQPRNMSNSSSTHARKHYQNPSFSQHPLFHWTFVANLSMFLHSEGQCCRCAQELVLTTCRRHR